MSALTLIEPITGRNGPVLLPEVANWRQGRTLYGGASALIAYAHATRAFRDLPPLRAAQVAFVAPISEEVELRSEIIRQGKNVTQVRSEIISEGTIALTSFWLFGTEREANAVHPAAKAEPWPGGPEDYKPLDLERGPSFLRENFEMRRAQDSGGPGEPVVRRWFRLKDHEAIDPVSSVILLGDTLPPGAMRAMRRQGPISSINWSLNLLEPEPATQDGWWLGETRSDHADHGYSSERLSLWNTDGQRVISGLQSVAIFG